MTAKRALYPGTFDPATLGHLDILRRALALFDEVLVLVAAESKAGLFPVTRRVALLQAVTSNFPGCKVEAFSGLFIEQIRQRRPDAVVRGIRSAMDYEHEWALAGVNRSLLPGSEYVFLLARPELAPVSSTLVRDVALHGGAGSRKLLASLVPDVVADALAELYGEES